MPRVDHFRKYVESFETEATWRDASRWLDRNWNHPLQHQPAFG